MRETKKARAEAEKTYAQLEEQATELRLDIELDVGDLKPGATYRWFRAKIFEGPSYKNIWFYPSARRNAVNKTTEEHRHYRLYFPGLWYGFDASTYSLSSASSFHLNAIGFWIPRGRHRQVFTEDEWPLPNGLCLGGGSGRFPTAPLAKILTEFWEYGFNLDDPARGSFFRELRGTGTTEKLAHWEQMSKGEVIDGLNQHYER